MNTIFRGLANLTKRIATQLKASSLRKYKVGRFFVDLLFLPSDIQKIFQSHKRYLGGYPNLISPRTFNECVQASKLFRRKSIHTQWADKLLVRNYVKETIGEEYLIPLLWSGDNLSDVDVSTLPKEFVIKVNQGSGSNIIVRDKNCFDWEQAQRTVSNWMKNDQSIPFAEWQYRWIEPKIIIEEFIKNPDGSPILDYKFFVFHGHVEIIQVDFDRFTQHKRNIYNRSFEKIDARIQHSQSDDDPPKPMQLEEMIRIAEKLSNREAFVRIDLYDVGRILFGEITIHPGAGHEKFYPKSFGYSLGALYRGAPGATSSFRAVPKQSGS